MKKGMKKRGVELCEKGRGGGKKEEEWEEETARKEESGEKNQTTGFHVDRKGEAQIKSLARFWDHWEQERMGIETMGKGPIKKDNLTRGEGKLRNRFRR